METIRRTVPLKDKELLVLHNERQSFLFNSLLGILPIPASNKNWEEIMCAGYNTKSQQLEAVVNIKQSSGYSGGLCSPGSTEYVRFFVDFKDGAGFQDLGYTTFKVADIPDSSPATLHPISYMAFLSIDEAKHRRFTACSQAVIPTVRVVLSWNVAPTSNPNQTPHYGNVINVDIQLSRPLLLFPFQLASIVKDQSFLELIDADEPIKLKKPFAENADIIISQNREAGVPDTRTFYTSAGSLLNPALNFTKAASSFSFKNLVKDTFDINKLLPFLTVDITKADTTFEELTCVGLNPAFDRLGAIIHVKKNNGFSGNLCSNGSREHVAFWADWDNDGVFDEYLGTVSVNVYDIANTPTGGLYYNVMLPLDTSNRLRACSAPNIIRVRAVLSWESLPSTTNPNQLNHWGNYVDAHVQLRPVNGQGNNGIFAAIEFVGGATRSLIHQSSSALENLYQFATFSPAIYNNRPWGGAISFSGKIDRNGYNGVVRYRILYKKFGEPEASFQPVSTTETFYLDNLSDSLPFYAHSQSNPFGWYEYDENPATHIYNVNNLLATWQAGSLTDGAYTIRFVTEVSGIETTIDQFSIVVCNKRMEISPTANTSVDLSKDLDLVIDGGDCHSYTPNDAIINGHLRAVHPYFADWSMQLEPASHNHFGIAPSPASRTYSSYGDNGDGNAPWTLNTEINSDTKLDPCGYTISISAHTRVILNSSLDFPQYAPKAVGFAKLP